MKEAEWNISITTSEITILRTRRKGRLRFGRSSLPEAVGGGELARIVLETSRVSSVIGGNSALSRYSSNVGKENVNFKPQK